MKTKSKGSENLLSLLKDNKIMTIDEIKIALKTQSRMTAFRKLSLLEYITSYSHSGKYYSLKRIARFNKYGIWSHKSALFSKNGTLLKTIEYLINDSIKGYSASELNIILKVKVEDTLFGLVKNKKIVRNKMSGIYIYYSIISNLRKKQELTRTEKIRYSDVEMKPDILMNELNAALIIFYSTLDEKQRRLYAGYESLKIGHGGDKRIAELLDIDQKTVAKGRRELLGGNVNIDNVRESGAGRKQTKKKSQTLSKK